MQKDNKLDKIDNKLVEEMFKAGAHYGYSKARRHPSVSSFIYANKNKVDIIDIEKTNIMLSNMKEYAKELGSAKKVVLFVGTKPESKKAIKEIAESLEMPYVIERWIGGTLTNFVEIKKRIDELYNYIQDKKIGSLEKYTKKERVVLAKKMERLEKYYTGLLSLKKKPDAIFIIDTKKEEITCKEAKKMNVPIIGLLNTDSNIKNIDYPILANDASIPSISFFINEFEKSYKELNK